MSATNRFVVTAAAKKTPAAASEAARRRPVANRKAEAQSREQVGQRHAVDVVPVLGVPVHRGERQRRGADDGGSQAEVTADEHEHRHDPTEEREAVEDPVRGVDRKQRRTRSGRARSMGASTRNRSAEVLVDLIEVHEQRRVEPGVDRPGRVVQRRARPPVRQRRDRARRRAQPLRRGAPAVLIPACEANAGGALTSAHRAL